MPLFDLISLKSAVTNTLPFLSYYIGIHSLLLLSNNMKKKQAESKKKLKQAENEKKVLLPKSCFSEATSVSI